MANTDIEFEVDSGDIFISKIDLAKVIALSGWQLLQTKSRMEALGGCSGPVQTTEIAAGTISLMLITPETGAPGIATKYLLDISADHKKVFSLGCNSTELADLELISFKRGPWILSVLKEAAPFIRKKAAVETGTAIFGLISRTLH